MRRCAHSRIWLRGDGVEAIDPDDVVRRIGLVFPLQYKSGDLAADIRAPLDVVEHRRARLRQKLYLARYARQDVRTWDDRDVRELDEYFAALSEMIKAENKHAARHEDS